MNQKRVWISFKPFGGWRKHNGSMDTAYPENRDEAIIAAREIAKKQATELSALSASERYLMLNCYGRDPFPSRD
jgi:hypothetical protein